MRGIPPDAIRNLCSTCSSLNLSADSFVVNGRDRLGSNRRQETGRGQYYLGTLAEIRRKGRLCPLCSLIIRSAQEQTKQDVSSISQHSTVTCHAQWQIDGREMNDTSTGEIIRARTRRIRLSWTNPDFQDAYIVLFTDHHWEDSNVFLGREAEQRCASVLLLKSWIGMCCESHGLTCNSEAGPGFHEMRSKPYFGVIDVHDMRLTSLPPDARYVALSYTWGPGDRFTTTSSKLRALRNDHGIKDALGEMPQAIRDAISLVRKLGERYIWVDSICIVQDSADWWNLNSKMMDQIYGNAYLTVCAADNPNASAGLMALDPSKRCFQQHVEECLPGLSLMVSHPAETYIQKSVWNSRAWTFQERLLSKRCLIFTDGRVYYQCRSTTMSEDIVEQRHAGWSIELVNAPLQILRDLRTQAPQVYNDCVRLYTLRSLTHQKDVLSAFNGVNNLIGDTLETGFVFGLPSSHFDWALLWEPRGPLTAFRRFMEGGSWVESRQFPSWSWCGWKGAVHYKPSTISGTNNNLHQWLMQHTWIVWYIRDGHGQLRQVWGKNRRSTDTRKLEPQWEGYPRAVTDDEPNIDDYGRVIRWPEKPRTHFESLLQEYPYDVAKAGLYAEPDPSQQDMRYLQFWTWSATFYLTEEDPSKRRYGLADSRGDWCGTVIVHTDASLLTGQDSTYHFIAISDAHRFSLEETDTWTYYIPKERDQSEWDLYYVLLITYDEHHIAERAGFGKVYKDAFANSCGAGPEWKEIILG